MSMVNLIIAFFLLFSACLSPVTKDGKARMKTSSDYDKILIVSLSRTNNTKAIAEIIHEKMGGLLIA